ncbi:hypothetical protein QQS21_000954 [Conoideocrella luteorostrata]|uniref:Amidohydrolase-related domain-containing protein n=1 Tax=Conoideocrella luteorostrata TaxID=1105319 RepID=A0AAJ0D0H4_9HYPO|nr:hypothetical protein QQS21_000954 [Conoideocrella luteorostrata]
MDNHKSFVIDHVRIFTGDKFIESGFLRVNSGRITEVGHGPYREPGPDVRIISRPGDTLIPGLIDAHIHGLGGNVHSLEQSLRFGVTTVCDMHNDPSDNVKLRNLATDPSQKSMYADFKCAGLGAIIDSGWPIPVMKKEFEHIPNGHAICNNIISRWPKLKQPADAEPFVQQQKEKNNASYIKMFHEVGDSIGMDMPNPSPDLQRAVVQAAHKHGLIAVGHAFSYAGAMALIGSGADGLTHMFLDQPPSDEFLRAMLSQNMHCSPTLALCASQTGEDQDFFARFYDDPFAQEMLLNRTPGRPVGFAASETPRSSVNHAYESTKALYKAGVPVVVGTDAAGREIGTPYGLGVHMEMYLLSHKIGMAPADVLKAATTVTADRFGFDDIGRLEPGRKADMVLIRGDVEKTLQDPGTHCLPIATVWREGVLACSFA